MLNSIIRFFCKIACNIWWPIWSTIRWWNDRDDVDIDDDDKVSTLEDIMKLVSRLYSKFKWTADGADQLFDSICPPPYNYRRYKNGLLEDDCDGFHSLVYHCLRKSGIECYLLSVIVPKGSHCVLVFKLDDKWYLDDYITVYVDDSSNSIKEVIDEYDSIYPDIYNLKNNVVYNALIGYDYEQKKFYSTTVDKLMK